MHSRHVSSRRWTAGRRWIVLAAALLLPAGCGDDLSPGAEIGQTPFALTSTVRVAASDSAAAAKATADQVCDGKDDRLWRIRHLVRDATDEVVSFHRAPAGSRHQLTKRRRRAARHRRRVRDLLHPSDGRLWDGHLLRPLQSGALSAPVWPERPVRRQAAGARTVAAAAPFSSRASSTPFRISYQKSRAASERCFSKRPSHSSRIGSWQPSSFLRRRKA